MVRLALLSALALAVFGLAVMSFSGRSSAGAPIVVNTSNDAGAGSLRQAILDANAGAGFDTITFDASVFPPGTPAVISPLTELPAMDDPDGTSVDGTGAGVIIDGAGLAGNEMGLRFHSGAGIPLNNAMARNLTVRNFPHRGIYMCGGDGVLSCINHDNNNSLIDGVTLIGNGDTGAYITGKTVTNAVITNTVTMNNALHGVEINSCTGDMIEPVVTDNTSMANERHGLQVNSCDDIVDATITGNTSLDNEQFGMQVNSADQLINPTVSDNVASDNDQKGIYANASDGILGADIARNRVELNGEEGIFVRSSSGIIDELDIYANLVRNNIGDGVLVDAGALSLAHDRNVIGNIICGNVASGLNADDTIPQEAQGNWWGHVTGPAPGGLGDAIIGPGAGVADATPWIDTVTGSADAAITGEPGVVRFQFSDAAASVFLGQGLSTGYPFTISTDNGTITSSRSTGSSAPEVINAPDGTVEVVLTPKTAGQATVEIEGPCGLGSLPGATLAVEVTDATPTPSSTPTPDASATASPVPTDTEAPTDTGAPTVTATPVPSETPAGQEAIWGDNNCSGPPPNPVDALLALRHDASLSTNTGACPAMGTQLEVTVATLRLWGDIDCSDAVDPVDALKLLRFDAGLSVSQGAGCPELGETVLISEV
ncbi:MAG TPA: hypothetical protein VMR52_01655 [Dehalococcoidia bacterium]|nr:hypothetical protein [Dehalococcoidia bacterium]